jgi:CHAT domain-containing protein
MGLLPLHAAGHNWDTSLENTSGRVISSYIATFKALEYATRKDRQSLDEKPLDILLVEGKINQNVPGVQRELKNTQRILSSDVTQKVLHAPTKDQVIAELYTCNMAHFTCPAITDPKDLSNSSLKFGDTRGGDSDSLTIRELGVKPLKNTRLAYLSACRFHSPQYLVDGMFYVANAVQNVGFPHVIGSMWAVRDNAAVAVAETFYENLVRSSAMSGGDGKMRRQEIAWALHGAVRAL